MLTDYQLEIAAREFCRLRGQDPDLPTPVNWNLERRLWNIAALQIREHEQMRWAIDFASEQGCTSAHRAHV